MDRRKYSRKLLGPIHVTNIESADGSMFLAHEGKIINASATGMLIEVSCDDLSPELKLHKLLLETIEGEMVVMKIAEMDLDIDARVVRTRSVGSNHFEIAVDFAENAPTYWRECLVELLPNPGEIQPVEPSGNTKPEVSNNGDLP